MRRTRQDFEQMNRLFAHLDRSPAAVRARLSALEALLEGSIRLPGTQRRFGLDAILGLVPVLGDVIGGLLSSYFIWEARNLGMSKWQLTRMGANVVIDTALGFVPLVGDVFDFVFRSNSRNLKIVKNHLDRHHPDSSMIEGEVISRR